MTFNQIVKRFGKMAADNSPTILTAIAVTGTLTTAYFTGKASFKAAQLIREQDDSGDLADEGWPILKDHIQLVWRLYIPALISGVLTVTTIIFVNRIGDRRTAALAAAYTISERALVEYKDKVIEKIGDKKARDIRDEIAQDKVNKNPPKTNEIIVAGSGSFLCYEEFTGRYFISDMEALRKAQNDINHQILYDNYASLSDFYDLIGLPHTAQSSEIGWNSDKMLELEFSAVITEEGSRPCMSVGFVVAPIRNHNRFQ